MSQQTVEVIINKEINAPAAKVYQAWTQPELVKQWFAPGNNIALDAQVDLQEGKEYLFAIHDPDNNSDHIVSGTYEEIIPNKKLVFNWMWKDGVDRTRVTVELSETSTNTTLLTLTHTGFSQQEFADKHTSGWNACLDSMLALFTHKTTAA